MPDVTVLLPVYNAMPFLPMAIESILTQSLREFELLIVDDGSTDKTRTYLESLRDDRIRVLRRKHEGLGATLNAGLLACNTPYIARMDGDDVMHPRRLEVQREYLNQNSSVCMVGSYVEFIVRVPTGLVARVPTEHREIVERLLAKRNGICHPAMMMRLSAVRRIGGYHIAGIGEDLDFCLRMCEAGRAANLAGVYHYYRLLPSSASFGRRPEILSGYSYAVETAKCRRTGSPEPTLENFRTRWGQRNVIRRFVDLLEDWSICQYRLSIIDRAEGRFLRGYCRLLNAAVAQPQRCIWHLKVLAKDWINRVSRSTAIARSNP